METIEISKIIIASIVRLLSGAAGGNLAAKLLKDSSLGLRKFYKLPNEVPKLRVAKDRN